MSSSSFLVASLWLYIIKFSVSSDTCIASFQIWIPFFLFSAVTSCFCSVAQSCATPWTTAWQAFLSLRISQSLPRFMSIVLVMPSSHLILWRPLLLFSQSFLASGSFPMSHLFASSDQKIGVSVSASVLPMNIQGWYRLGLTGFSFKIDCCH